MKDYDENKLIPLSAVMEEMMQDPEFAAAYEAIQVHKKMVAELKAARLAESLTQEDIARRTGIKNKISAGLKTVPHPRRLIPSVVTRSRLAALLNSKNCTASLQRVRTKVCQLTA